MSASEPGSPSAPAVDVVRLVAEIEADVRARRASGEYPPDLERELDELFDRFAPPAVSDSFEAALTRAEQRGFITDDAPTESARPGSPQMKRAIVRVVGWYVRHIVVQVNELSANVTRALRLLGDRVQAVEAAVPAVDPRLREIPDGLPGRGEDAADLAGSIVTDALRGSSGRVAVVECGVGAVLRNLVDGGVDAYGVEADITVADAAAAAGLEVRGGDPLEHLRGLAPDVLSGLVLFGWIEQRPVGDLVEVAERAASVLEPAGRVILLSRTPEWFTASDPVRADLLPGRPLHAVTWAHLLAEQGFESIEIHEVTTSDGVAGWYSIAGSRPAAS